MKYTPPPWKIEKTGWDYATVITKDDRIIARCGSSDFLQAEADAAFIVRAVNAYEELVERLTRAYSELHDSSLHKGAFEDCQVTSCRVRQQATAKIGDLRTSVYHGETA